MNKKKRRLNNDQTKILVVHCNGNGKIKRYGGFQMKNFHIWIRKVRRSLFYQHSYTNSDEHDQIYYQKYDGKDPYIAEMLF